MAKSKTIAKNIGAPPIKKVVQPLDEKLTNELAEKTISKWESISEYQQPKKSNNLWRTVYNWTLFFFIAAVIYGIYKFVPFENIWHKLPTMGAGQVLFFALALAFGWVEVLKWGTIKPFSCVKCMSGWFALSLAILFHAEFWYLYLPSGVFVGAMFEVIKMRLL